MIRFIWIVCGFLALTLGVVGMALPLLPTVPFLLLAAFCFGRGSERVHRWLLAHSVFGPPIQDWRERGAIRRKAKWIASGSILAALAMSLALGVRQEILAVQVLALLAVTMFIWTRPDH